MMDPTIISAGATLLGGLFGKKDKPLSFTQIRKQTSGGVHGQARGARDAGEKYGFNPLALLGLGGAGVGSTVSSGNYMGEAIANAGLIVADGLQKRQDALALNSKETEVATLRKKVESLTLRPKVAGIFPTIGAPIIDPNPVLIDPRQKDDDASETYPTETRDEFGMVEANVGDRFPGRATDRNRGQNEPWNKEMELLGRTYNVWNDEASDSEIAAGAMLLSIPSQFAAQKTNEFFKRRAIRKKAPDLAGSVKRYGNKPRVRPMRFDANNRDGYFYP